MFSYEYSEFYIYETISCYQKYSFAIYFLKSDLQDFKFNLKCFSYRIS